MNNDSQMTPELDELVKMIGADRVGSLLRRFSVELQAFDNPLSDAGDATARAHRLVSQAGMLGFHALSKAARAFESGQAGHQTLPETRATLLGEVRTVSTLIQALLNSIASGPAAIRSC